MEPSHPEFWQRARELGILIHQCDRDGPACDHYPDIEPYICSESWEFVTCEACKRSPDYEYWVEEGEGHASL